MVKAATLYISSHSLPQAMEERSAQSEHMVPHEQRAATVFSLSF